MNGRILHEGELASIGGEFPEIYPLKAASEGAQPEHPLAHRQRTATPTNPSTQQVLPTCPVALSFKVMSAMNQPDRLSIEDYLAGELVSETKLEYVAGAVYAMAGASNRHNAIVGNAFGQLFLGLRGKPCRPFNSDTKVRIDLGNGTRFFYPDAMVVCDRNPDEDSFQQQPVVILEVLSPTTRRLDLEEKYQAYLQIPSLRVLLFIEQDLPAVTCHRRQAHGAFAQEMVQGLDGVIDLPEIDTTLALADIYQNQSFT